MPNRSDAATEERIDDGTDELTSRQIDAARLLATNPDRTKESIAASLKISRRTIFRWCADERFREKIEEFRRSRIEVGDAKSVLAMLSKKDKRELMTLLLAERENRHLDLPEIEELERKIMEVAEGDRDPLQKVTKGAIEKVELLLGRLRSNALCYRDYEPDGRPVERTPRETVDELMQMGIIAAKLGEDKDLVRAVAEAWGLIGERMGEEQRQHSEPGWDRRDTNHDEEPEEEDYADEMGDEGYDEEPGDIDDGLGED